MKKFLFFVILIFFAIPAFSQWQLSSGTTGQTIKKIVKTNDALFAGVEVNIFNGRILKSTNNGSSWDSINVGFHFSGIFDMTTIGNNIFAGTYETGMIYSTNGGLNWQQNWVNGVNGNGVFNVTSSGNIVFARNNTVNPPTYAVFYYSSNFGSSWNPINTGSLGFQPANFFDTDSVLYCASEKGVVYSTNHGLNWTLPANTGLPTFPDGRKSLYSVLYYNGTLYAGSITGFAYSSNKGTSWTNISLNLPSYNYISDIVRDGNNLYAAFYGGIGSLFTGVYKSTNFGLNWYRSSIGLPDAGIYSMIQSAGSLIAGEQAAGVWFAPLFLITQTVSNQNTLPSEFILYQNYPNPFNPSTTISFSLLKSSEVSLKIFDISGRVVISEILGIMQKGKHEYKFSSGNLTSGIYFYKVIADNYSDTKSMILIK